MDAYLDIPEDLSRAIEVLDGLIVHCESPSPNHQAIQHNLVTVLGEAVDKDDSENRSCHKVRGDLDVLFSEVPFRFRRPDVTVYRCVPEGGRGKWGQKPWVSDVVLALEVVSVNTVSSDLSDKRAEYARADIPHYWIVRMMHDDGPAVSVSRLRLDSFGDYVHVGASARGRDPLAIDAVDPIRVQASWEALDFRL
jgi:Uma2 family endonuclease